MTGAGFAEKVGASNAFTLQGKEFVITPGSSEVTSPNITDASQITPAIKNALKSAKVTLLKYNDAQGTPQRYPVQ